MKRRLKAVSAQQFGSDRIGSDRLRVIGERAIAQLAARAPAANRAVSLGRRSFAGDGNAEVDGEREADLASSAVAQQAAVSH